MLEDWDSIPMKDRVFKLISIETSYKKLTK